MKKLLLLLCVGIALLLCTTGCKDKCVVNPELITENGWTLDSVCNASECLDRSVIDAPAPGIVSLLTPFKIFLDSDFKFVVDFVSHIGIGDYTLTEMNEFGIVDFANIGKTLAKSPWYDLVVANLKIANRLTIDGNQLRIFVDDTGTVLSFTKN